MREYWYLKKEYWRNKKIKSWGDTEKLLSLYLIEGPHTNEIGYFYCPTPYIMHDLNWSEDKTKRALQKLMDVGFIFVDKNEWIFIKTFLEHNLQGANRNVWKFLRSVYNLIPDDAEYFEELNQTIKSLSTCPDDLISHFERTSESLRTDIGAITSTITNTNTSTSASTSTSTKQPKVTFEEIEAIKTIQEKYLSKWPKRKAQAIKPKNIKLIKDRLAENYTVQDICDAIDGNSIREFNVQGGFHNLELIVRSAEQIDLYMTEWQTRFEVKPNELSKADRQLMAQKKEFFREEIDEFLNNEDRNGHKQQTRVLELNPASISSAAK